MTFDLPGGYQIAFTVHTAGGPVAPSTLPTFSAAYLGNGGYYTGIQGSPALYQSDIDTRTTIQLTNIHATDSTGALVSGYALVGADAESTDVNESVTWNSSSPIGSLTATAGDSGLNNACGGGFTGVGTTTVTCTGTAAVPGRKTGTAIVAAEKPSTFGQAMVGGGLQGVAFGVLVSTVQLTKNIVNGFPGDSFETDIASESGSVLGSGTTGSTGTGTTGEITVLTGPTGETYRLTESSISGLASNYTRSWSCLRSGVPDASLASGDPGPSITARVAIGDDVDCTITNTAKPASLQLVKHASNPVDVNRDGLTDTGDTIGYSFTVTNTGQLVMNAVTVSDPKAGTITCPSAPLLPGASVTCQAGSPYVVTPDDVTDGAVLNTAMAVGTPPGVSQPIPSNPSTTTTLTAAPFPSLSIRKSSLTTTADSVGQQIPYGFTVTNEGNVTMTDVSVTDTQTAPALQTNLSDISCPSTVLTPTASMTCTATYSVTQADLDNGRITDTAVATGLSPTGLVTITPPASLSIPTASIPSAHAPAASAPPAEPSPITPILVVVTG